MPYHIDGRIPAVAVANISEPFADFLNREEEPERKARLIWERQVKGERAALWLGDAKLVLTTFPVAHAAYLRQRLGYRGTFCLTPDNPSPRLCLDILREPALIQRLVDHAGEERQVQLIPYATTREFYQLVDALRTDHGLEVMLPESPNPEDLWLREYVDSKAGFRLLVSQWLADAHQLLPEGVVCRDLSFAAEVVHWFSEHGKPCIVKADDGEGSIGHTHHADRKATVGEILRRLEANALLRRSRCIVVEAFVASSRRLYPSLEVFVPRRGQGVPDVTYVCNQQFLPSGTFAGVSLSRDWSNATWYSQLVERGLAIATRLQERGYVGHFDLDAIVADDDRLVLLEVNGRRTGGTHVHEFACFTFGPDYADDLALLSHDAMESGAVSRLDDLMALMDDLLFPSGSEGREGIVISLSSTLVDHRFGIIVVAPSTERTLALQEMVRERIEKASNAC